jgi:hypothetical protein
MIETRPSLNSSSIPGFKVTKVANGPGAYELKFIGGCANWFGCTPTVAESQADFADYVMAAAEPSEPAPRPLPPPQPSAGRKRSSS